VTFIGGDLHVVVMGDQYVGIVHPCKIYNVLAVKKPFLYIGPNESHVTDIIRQYDAYVSSHGDAEGVVTNILRATRISYLVRRLVLKWRRCFRKIGPRTFWHRPGRENHQLARRFR
jgi:hypothetical protein